MKKIFLSLSILVLSSMAMMAAGSSQNPAITEKSQTEQVKKHDKDRKKSSDKKHDKKKHDNKKGGMDHKKKAFINPFEGLNLTDQQKTQIEELQKNFAPDRKKISKDEKAKLSDDQKKKKREEIRVFGENKRKEYLAALKNILTPEQYIQFLENSYLKSKNINLSKGINPRNAPQINKPKPKKDKK